MDESIKPLRVLHSFPHRLGKARICTTAWYEIDSAAAAGAEMFVLAGDSVRPFPRPVNVKTTLSRGKLRIPHRLLGTLRSCKLHDWIVARQLPKLVGQIDIIHAWPLGSLQTIRAAKRLGIPVALERCNAHTRFAYEVVRKECESLGIQMPPEHEHAFNEEILNREETEYELADYLLCPSDFVERTFVDQGVPREKLLRHQYGFDDKTFYPGKKTKKAKQGLTMIFVGGCAPRKGLHYALEAWINSSASKDGNFLIAGEFIPEYAKKLGPLLAHPSISVLGHRKDVPELMRKSDILILPSIEEGSALVTSEARGSGCVLVVSEGSGAICRHMENALVHSVGDVQLLIQHLTMLDKDRTMLEELLAASLRSVHEITWAAAGKRLVKIYSRMIAKKI